MGGVDGSLPHRKLRVVRQIVGHKDDKNRKLAREQREIGREGKRNLEAEMPVMPTDKLHRHETSDFTNSFIFLYIGQLTSE